jgi:hypothetical protein
MRAILAVSCIAILLPAALFAQAPPVSYMGIYADEDRTTWCASGTAPYQIDVWVYMDIGENGAWAYSFDLEIPPNVVILTIDVNRYEGGPWECIPPYCPQGIAGEFGLCLGSRMFSSIWIVHATANVTDGDPSLIRIVPNPDIGAMWVENCDFEYETPPILTHLYVNYDASEAECGTLPVDQSTWGAIKSLYR